MTDVLLVEDHDADVLLVREAVASFEQKVRLHVVRDGLAALWFLRRQGDYARCPSVQLVLLDSSMPRMNACEVLRELRTDEATRDVPVVVFSSSARPRDVHACTEAGANGYVVKPVDLASFMDVVQGLLKDWLRASR
ncbi:response regulator [Deinococcus yavapaiensis]|uniref:Two-component system response regulator n=1 Tax=Deinococcus yavapaiensis KR-236 TaxID=694435 RepID=A0A318S231_9DEIO|nr:response regulator [Deinococcus yavapaiensis]PYE50544.1 two-component system response regulator [Deinococcus yavapaiensis KR-236]